MFSPVAIDRKYNERGRMFRGNVDEKLVKSLQFNVDARRNIARPKTNQSPRSP
jgi:hypothetical protein